MSGPWCLIMSIQEIIKEIDQAKQYLSEYDVSIVAIKNGTVIGAKKGNGIRPFLELIDDYKNELIECIIGDRILGKASALLCRYINTRGVYASQGTKTAIDILGIEGIPYHIDEYIEYIKNRTQEGLCPFEELLENVNEPNKAFHLLYERIMKI